MLAAECLPGGAAAVGMDAGVGVVALSALALMQRTGGLARTRQATGRCTDNAHWPGMAVAPGGRHWAAPLRGCSEGHRCGQPQSRWSAR